MEWSVARQSGWGAGYGWGGSSWWNGQIRSRGQHGQWQQAPGAGTGYGVAPPQSRSSAPQHDGSVGVAAGDGSAGAGVARDGAGAGLHPQSRSSALQHDGSAVVAAGDGSAVRPPPPLPGQPHGGAAPQSRHVYDLEFFQSLSINSHWTHHNIVLKYGRFICERAGTSEIVFPIDAPFDVALCIHPKGTEFSFDETAAKKHGGGRRWWHTLLPVTCPLWSMVKAKSAVAEL